MDTFDIKVFGLLAVGTTTLVGALKRAFPKLMTNREELASIILPLIAVVALKASGQLGQSAWVDALMWAFTAGLGGGVIHDKVVNPLLRRGAVAVPPTTTPTPVATDLKPDEEAK
jgi:hypothetical protein